MKASHFCHFLIGILLVGYIQAQTFDELVDLSRIASIFKYPVNKLTISDLTEEAKTRHGANLLSACIIDSSDRTFAPISVAVSTKGTLLSKEFEQDIIEWLQKIQDYPELTKIARKLDFGDGAYGYIGLAGVGPGGSEELFVATFPRKNKDLIVKIMIPAEDPLKVVPETEAYDRLLSEGREGLLERLIECAEAIIAKLKLIPPASAQQTPLRPIPPSASSVVSEDNSKSSQETSDPRPSPAVEAEPPKSTPWLWIIGAILLLAAAAEVLVKLLRK